MPYLGSQRTLSPSAQVSDLASGVVTIPSNVNVAGSGAFELISSYTLNGSETTTTFSSISSVYDILWIIIEGRNSTSTSRAVSIQFNGDTTSGNYIQQYLQEENGSQTHASSTSGLTSISYISFPGTGVTAGYPAVYFIQVLGIQEQTFKNVWMRASRITSVSSESVNGVLQGVYQGSTSPITSVTVRMGSSENFVSGSKIHLYGIRGA
jgi:hypothetical protein